MPLYDTKPLFSFSSVDSVRKNQSTQIRDYLRCTYKHTWIYLCRRLLVATMFRQGCSENRISLKLLKTVFMSACQGGMSQREGARHCHRLWCLGLPPARMAQDLLSTLLLFSTLRPFLQALEALPLLPPLLLFPPSFLLSLVSRLSVAWSVTPQPISSLSLRLSVSLLCLSLLTRVGSVST